MTSTSSATARGTSASSSTGSAPFHEVIAPDEEARFNGYAAELVAMQRRRAKGGPLDRALHAKAHVGAVGELVVADGLDEQLRAAVFAEPGHRWPAYVRFSNGAGDKRGDRGPDARGIGVKLVGVPGQKIIPGLADALTQDFLFVQSPSLAFRDPDEFMTFVRAAVGSPVLLPFRLAVAFGLGRTVEVLRQLASMPKVPSMATTPFYTAAPIRFGSTAAKLALVPESSAPAAASSSGSPHALRDDLVARLASGPIVYSVRAQLFVDALTTPIEDTSVLWPEHRSPYVEVGRLTVHQQDVSSPRGQEIAQLVETLSFDPWHAVPELRPLGSIMRARATAYRESVLARQAAAEPTSVLPPG